MNNKLFLLTYDMNETNQEDLKETFSQVRETLSKDCNLIVMPRSFQLTRLDTKTLSDLKDHIESILYSRYHQMEQLPT